MTDEQENVSLPKKIFDCQQIKKSMHEILHENLHNQQYNSDEYSSLTRTLSNLIKNSLKTLGYERYKFIVQILICDDTNENLQMFCRAYWDSQTDKFAQSIYMNQFLICVATTFGVYYY